MNYHVLVIDDDPFQCKIIQMTIEKLLGFNVSTLTSSKAALELLLSPEGDKVNMVILDLSMPEISGMELLEKICPQRPDLPIIVNTAHGDVKMAVEAIKKGAIDFIEKQDGSERLKLSIENVRLMAGLNKELKKLHSFANNRFEFKDIIGSSPAISKTVNAAKKASNSNIPVLIHGESGAGKELFARAIHSSSIRSNKPFVAVNCGAIPHNLVESVLFGHEKGAFTGAIEKSVGKFREADGGTIFLDEVGELPLETQTKLLRALQNFEIEPVGSSKLIDVNIRIISATNKNLEKAVQEGKFREDLYYRLNVFQINVPSLREREEDIPLLIEHFIQKICTKEMKKIFPIEPQLVSILKDYWWPGNVRQLENAIYRAIVLSNNEKLTMEDFDNILAAVSNNNETGIENTSIHTGGYGSKFNAKFKTISEYEKDIILKALEYYNHNISRVSKVLNIGRSTLYRKMKEYHIDIEESIEEIEEFKKAQSGE